VRFGGRAGARAQKGTKRPPPTRAWSVRLVVQARHHDRALGGDLGAVDRRPEQVRRQHDDVVAPRLGEQVKVQLGHAESAVHPGNLRRRAQLLAALDALFEAGGDKPTPRSDRREPPDDHPRILRGPVVELVRPAEMRPGAGREDVDLVATANETACRLGHHGLGASYDAGTVPRRDEGKPHSRPRLSRHAGRLLPRTPCTTAPDEEKRRRRTIPTGCWSCE
jgi:hypothetical protein